MLLKLGTKETRLARKGLKEENQQREMKLLERQERVLYNLYLKRATIQVVCKNCGWEGKLAQTLFRLWHDMSEYWYPFYEYRGRGKGLFCPRCKENIEI